MVNMHATYHENLSTGLVARRYHIFIMESTFFNNDVFLNFSQTYVT